MIVYLAQVQDFDTDEYRTESVHASWYGAARAAIAHERKDVGMGNVPYWSMYVKGYGPRCAHVETLEVLP